MQNPAIASKKPPTRVWRLRRIAIGAAQLMKTNVNDLVDGATAAVSGLSLG